MIRTLDELGIEHGRCRQYEKINFKWLQQIIFRKHKRKEYKRIVHFI